MLNQVIKLKSAKYVKKTKTEIGLNVETLFYLRPENLIWPIPHVHLSPTNLFCPQIISG